MTDVFEFRDFSMQQAAMGQRINTDSCVFGALVGAEKIQPRRIVDIGAGTGVITLMQALRFPNANVTAVEPEPSIADVAQKNFDQDAWRDRITLLRTRIQDLVVGPGGQFDFVLCNPPYFLNSTLSTNHVTAIARHAFDLSPAEIYQAMLRLMTPDGSAWLSFPHDYRDLWLSAGKALGLHPTHHIVLSEHPTARPHVEIVGWSKTQPANVAASTLFYREAPQGALSPWMKSFRKTWFPARFNKNMYAV